MKRRIDHEQETAAKFAISSMVDVGFLLLIYFLVVATLQPVEADLRAGIGGPPRDGQFEQLPPTEIVLQADGSVVLDGVLVAESDATRPAMPALEAKLKDLVEIGRILEQAPTVILDLSDDAPHQGFASVLNALAGARIDRIAIRAGASASSASPASPGDSKIAR